MLRAARAKTLTTQDWTAFLGLERNGVGLAALIANDLEPLALAAATAARLSRAAKIRATCIATRFAAFRMTQSSLAIIILFSFGEWESGSALGASDIQIRHSCLPEKSLADSVLGDESLPHARFAVQGKQSDEVSTEGGSDRVMTLAISLIAIKSDPVATAPGTDSIAT